MHNKIPCCEPATSEDNTIENEIETEASTHEKTSHFLVDRIRNFVSKQHQIKLINSHF